MKKLIVTLAVIVAAFTASNAQVYVGGSLGWTWNNDKPAYLIKPEVGYNFNENWAAGLDLGYGYNSNNKLNGIVVGAYARYKFWNEGLVTFFVDGGGAYSNWKVKDADAVDGFEVGLKPGLLVHLSPSVDFVTKYGFIGYRDDFAPFNGTGASVSGLDLSSETLSIGFVYKF